jgi:hypothetical protein
MRGSLSLVSARIRRGEGISRVRRGAAGVASELEHVAVQVWQIVFCQDNRSGCLQVSIMTTGNKRAIRNAYYALNAAARIIGSAFS